MNTCKCRLCCRHKRIEQIVARQNLHELTSLIDELENDLMHVEDDVNWYQCIFNGSWPNGKEILERKLLNYGNK